jgi:hypothetical protein
MAKAGRPKSGSKGLPDWFDIQKYAQGRTNGAAEWFQQLAFRSALQEFISSQMPLPYRKQ